MIVAKMQKCTNFLLLNHKWGSWRYIFLPSVIDWFPTLNSPALGFFFFGGVGETECFRVNSLFVDFIFVHYTSGVCIFLVLVPRKEMGKVLSEIDFGIIYMDKKKWKEVEDLVDSHAIWLKLGWKYLETFCQDMKTNISAVQFRLFQSLMPHYTSD